MSWNNQNSNGCFATPAFCPENFLPLSTTCWPWDNRTYVTFLPSHGVAEPAAEGIHKWPSCKHLNQFSAEWHKRLMESQKEAPPFPERFIDLLKMMLLFHILMDKKTCTSWYYTYTTKWQVISHHSPDLSVDPSAHDFIGFIQIKGRRLIGTIRRPVFPGAKHRNGRNMGNQLLGGSLIWNL